MEFAESQFEYSTDEIVCSVRATTYSKITVVLCQFSTSNICGKTSKNLARRIRGGGQVTTFAQNSEHQFLTTYAVILLFVNIYLENF